MVLAATVAAAVAVAAAGTAISVAWVCGHSRLTAACPLGQWIQRAPKAVVDRPLKELGVIETPEEFAQTFVIRNQGDAPLELSRGPSTCRCTVTELPDRPIPPGGRGDVRVGFSAAARRDTLKSGRLSQSVSVLCNDPDNPSLLLRIEATVRCRLAAAPSPITLAIASSDLPREEKRSAQTLIYSQTWDRFELAAVRMSRRGMTCRIERAPAKELDPFQARSGYRVRVALPADMPDGRFAESVEFAARPAAPAGPPRPLELQIDGSVDGRVTIFGPKVDDHGVLRLGVLQEGQGARETMVMKVHDERPTLVFRRVETDPAFMRVRVSAYQGPSATVGLYRIEVEIPREAPQCNFMGKDAGTIRLRTDHPRLRVIEWHVDFAKLADEGYSGPQRLR